jgi:hypothetical protein
MDKNFRFVIHDAVMDCEDLVSESEGDDEMRHVVIYRKGFEPGEISFSLSLSLSLSLLLLLSLSLSLYIYIISGVFVLYYAPCTIVRTYTPIIDYRLETAIALSSVTSPACSNLSHLNVTELN